MTSKHSDDAITIGASFTSEIATLGIKIAMNEVAETVNNEIAYEMYAKQVFSYMVLRRSEKLTTLPANVTFGYKVVGVSNKIPGQDLGYVYFLTVENEEAFEGMRLLASQEAIFAGISSGGALMAALKGLKNIKNGECVILLPDTGERYLSVL